MIEFKNVSKSFRRTKVLTDLSFTVHAGKTVALLGLSGSGKTTALKLVCGLHLPDSGAILVSGEEMKPENLSSIRKKIGYVIQDGGLFPHLTCLGNLALVGREAGMSSGQIETRAKELAEMTKIAPALLKRYPREISGGQRQRIGIMRALFLDAPILLLDEPWAPSTPSPGPSSRGS
jgi:osmoprotectant transport system ATP-binding protein